jgi:hypothetical protein
VRVYPNPGYNYTEAISYDDIALVEVNQFDDFSADICEKISSKNPLGSAKFFLSYSWMSLYFSMGLLLSQFACPAMAVKCTVLGNWALLPVGVRLKVCLKKIIKPYAIYP